ECSNGSLILLAVVLWRTFCLHESPQNKDETFYRRCRRRRQARGLHALAKAGAGSTSAIGNQKQSRDDNSKSGSGQRIRHGWIQGNKSRQLSHFPEVVEAIREPADRWN